jgi:hypothetical protein
MVGQIGGDQQGPKVPSGDAEWRAVPGFGVRHHQELVGSRLNSHRKIVLSVMCRM